MKTVGQILSNGRSSKNLTISDIAIELKIPKSTIIDLENDSTERIADLTIKLEDLEEQLFEQKTAEGLENDNHGSNNDCHPFEGFHRLFENPAIVSTPTWFLSGDWTWRLCATH
mgnify:CR=1 FL=1